MVNHVAFDLSRLFIGPMTPVPRGIDRVDIAYARHLFEHSSRDCIGILPTPWGVRWFNQGRSLRVVDFIEDVWHETDEPNADPAYRWVKDRLLGKPLSVPLPKKRSAAARLSAGFARFIRKAGFSFGNPIATLPRNIVYLNTGQLGIAIPQLLQWLGPRKDIKAVFMLHDAIPIEYPEYISRWSSRAYRQMLINTARYAKGLILTTEAAARSIRRELASFGRPDIPALALHLPVSPFFLKTSIPDPELRDVTYFVVCGAIDPRKNHLLLLNIWRELVLLNNKSSPKLLIIGSRWRTSDAV
jgi:glycosyltransferase involved in cell wall biosynthesis